MTVFRGYLAIAKKNIHVIIMYFVIVTSLTVVMQNISRDNAGKQFELKKMDVGIVDRDKSELSEFIVKYLSGLHNVTAMEDDKSKLQESLYYNDRDCIIQIPKGFSKGAFEGEKQLEITKQPGSYGYVYLKQQVNELLNQFKTYISAGYGISEAYDKIAEKEESRIKLIDVSGNGGELPAHSYLFGFYPYLCISILCNILGLIISTFRKRDIKNRIAASAVSIKSQICGSVMSFIFIGTVIWFLSCIVLSAVLYGTDFYGSSNCGLYLINSYAIMLAILAISYLVGSIAKNALVVNIIVTPLSLVMSFLCGVFVPLSLLGEGVKKAAHFLPVYWYEVNNGIISSYASLSGEKLNEVWLGIGIQLLFAVVFIGIALVITKHRQQEK